MHAVLVRESPRTRWYGSLDPLLASDAAVCRGYLEPLLAPDTIVHRGYPEVTRSISAW